MVTFKTYSKAATNSECSNPCVNWHMLSFWVQFTKLKFCLKDLFHCPSTFLNVFTDLFLLLAKQCQLLTERKYNNSPYAESFCIYSDSMFYFTALYYTWHAELIILLFIHYAEWSKTKVICYLLVVCSTEIVKYLPPKEF